MLPDALAAFRLVLVEFGFAQLDQVLDLLVVEVLVADKGKPSSSFSTMPWLLRTRPTIFMVTSS
jgi:hypothetical protein